jgi:hypothetical protein
MPSSFAYQLEFALLSASLTGEKSGNPTINPVEIVHPLLPPKTKPVSNLLST